MTTLYTPKIRSWQIVTIFLFPVLYFINGLLPWSTELWVNHNREYYIPFFTSIQILHWTSFLIALYFLKSNNFALKDIGYNLNIKKTLYLLVLCLLVAIGMFIFLNKV